MQNSEHSGDFVKLLGVLGSIVLLALIIGSALFSGSGTVTFKSNNNQATTRD